MLLRSHDQPHSSQCILVVFLKAWVNSKAETVWNNYSRGVEEAETAAIQTASLEENGTPIPVDKNVLWIEHAGGRNKRTKHCYGDCNLDDDTVYGYFSNVTSERCESNENVKVWNEKFDGLSNDFNDLNEKLSSVLEQQSKILELLQERRN